MRQYNSPLLAWAGLAWAELGSPHDGGVQSSAARGSQGGTSQGLGRTQSFLAVITLGQSAVPGLTSHICILQDCSTAGLSPSLRHRLSRYPAQSGQQETRREKKCENWIFSPAGEIKCSTLQDKINQSENYLHQGARWTNWLARQGPNCTLIGRSENPVTVVVRTEEGV